MDVCLLTPGLDECWAASVVKESVMSDVEILLAQPDDLEAAVGVWERSRRDAQPWLEERMKYSHDDNLRHFRKVVMHENQVWLAVEESEGVSFTAKVTASKAKEAADKAMYSGKKKEKNRVVWL